MICLVHNNEISTTNNFIDNILSTIILFALSFTELNLFNILSVLSRVGVLYANLVHFHCPAGHIYIYMHIADYINVLAQGNYHFNWLQFWLSIALCPLDYPIVTL